MGESATIRRPYRIRKKGLTFQGYTEDACPHCGAAMSLMNYIPGLYLVCENRACSWRDPSIGQFFYQQIVEPAW